MRYPKMKPLIALAASLLTIATTSDAATVEAMRGARRVVLVAAPSADGRHLAAQRRLLDTWRGAADRDISVVEVIGNRVRGSDDAAIALRKRYVLPRDRFAVVLIGKDGHVALRSDTPLAAGTLEATIDAMPMRRAGER